MAKLFAYEKYGEVIGNYTGWTYRIDRYWNGKEYKVSHITEYGDVFLGLPETYEEALRIIEKYEKKMKDEDDEAKQELEEWKDVPDDECFPWNKEHFFNKR